MKLEIIETDGHLLVLDDSEIKEDDWVYNGFGVLYQVGRPPHRLQPTTKKIIAHLSLDMYSDLEGVLLLPPIDIEDDVEKLAEEKWKLIENTGNATANFKNGYSSGYYKAKQKYKFTEEDVRKAVEMARNNIEIGISKVSKVYSYNEEEIIQSLLQPKMLPTHFEFEMEKDYQYNDDGEPIGFKVHDSNKIKKTIKSQGQVMACGKYIYQV